MNITVINSFLQKLSTWVTAKSNVSTRIDFLLPTSVTFLRAITMCNAFSPDCGYDNKTNILIGDVYCPNANCLGKLCLHKKTFQSLSRSDYQCPQCASVCQVRNVPFEHQTNSFFLCCLVQGFTFMKRIQNQFKMLLKMCIVPTSIVSTERNTNLLVVSNNTEIQLRLWKVWSLVVCSQSSYHVTSALKDDKNRQTTLFLC